MFLSYNIGNFFPKRNNVGKHDFGNIYFASRDSKFKILYNFIALTNK